MTSGLMTCSMCGAQFDPALHVSCAACPLQKGCQLVCCPSCGFEMVNPEKSSLARLAARLLGLRNLGSVEEQLF